VASEACDCGLPELVGGNVGCTSADLPGTGEAEPDAIREFGTEASAAVAAEDEELGHVADAVLDLVDKCEACPCSVEASEEGVAPGVGPVERQFAVAEAAVGPGVDRDELAEVVDIELEEIGEDTLMFGACGDELESRGHGYQE